MLRKPAYWISLPNTDTSVRNVPVAIFAAVSNVMNPPPPFRLALLLAATPRVRQRSSLASGLVSQTTTCSEKRALRRGRPPALKH